MCIMHYDSDLTPDYLANCQENGINSSFFLFTCIEKTELQYTTSILTE